MSRYAVDASVVVKWFAPEIHSEHASRLLAHDDALLAPELLFIEVANVLWKQVRRGAATRGEATERLSGISARVLPIASVALTASALNIALVYDRSAYDALYVALAISEGCQVITADRRLYNALAPHLPETMLWIEDVPEPAA